MDLDLGRVKNPLNKMMISYTAKKTIFYNWTENKFAQTRTGSLPLPERSKIIKYKSELNRN